MPVFDSSKIVKIKKFLKVVQQNTIEDSELNLSDILGFNTVAETHKPRNQIN